METGSRVANLVRRWFSRHPAGTRCGQWVHGLLIAEAVLLVLVAGSVVLVVAWDMFKHMQPLPTFTANFSILPERSLATAMADTTPCIVHSAETVAV